ncbi:hypothetical protein NW754_010118 [Fusarium falciforme]|nr:hypothetical protein NW754_010118 [Fusarium falciforme]
MEGKVPRSPELSAESPSSAGFKTYSAAAASSAGRISLVSRHLSSPSSYNAASAAQSVPSSTQNRRLSTSTATMSSQPPHATLLIPGPIEFDDAVLQSMSHYSESHVGPGFVNTFGETLSMTRKLFQSTDPAAQPYVISGSGTLGWDLVAANLVEAGEDALVLSTGYFGDGFADCLRTYGANVTKLDGEVGGRPQLPRDREGPVREEVQDRHRHPRRHLDWCSQRAQEPGRHCPPCLPRDSGHRRRCL